MNTSMPRNNLIIKRPLVSERATDLSNFGKYVFLVERNARARQIKDAIERIYNVKVRKVNVMNVKTDDKNLRKAIVTLKAGDKIDVVPK